MLTLGLFYFIIVLIASATSPNASVMASVSAIQSRARSLMPQLVCTTPLLITKVTHPFWFSYKVEESNFPTNSLNAFNDASSAFGCVSFKYVLNCPQYSLARLALVDSLSDLASSSNAEVLIFHFLESSLFSSGPSASSVLLEVSGGGCSSGNSYPNGLVAAPPPPPTGISSIFILIL